VTIQIRDDRDTDFEALYRLDQECYEPGVAYSRRTLRAFMHEPGVFCRIAEESGGPQAGRMLGFVIAQQHQGEGHIITLDVPQAHRRRGIGSVLLRDAEQRLAEAGVREVELETAVDNAAGVAFWKKHGYCTCGVLEDYYEGKTDAYQMIKILSRSAAAKS
jgi:ribosomal-protein-alanine N-acetyltransferase